jgi:hypothetical protein
MSAGEGSSSAQKTGSRLLLPGGRNNGDTTLQQKKERAPEGALSFAESVSLSSTALADSRLPPNAFEIGFDLLALRARREREAMASGLPAQEVAKRKSPQIRTHAFAVVSQ